MRRTLISVIERLSFLGIKEHDVAPMPIQAHGAGSQAAFYGGAASLVPDEELGNMDRNGNEDILSPHEPHAHPEGGLRAWLVVLGSWCAMVACFGVMNSIGTFQAYIASHQLSHFTQGTVGWIFSLYVALAFFCGAIVGPIFDAKGPRVLLLGGSTLLVLSMMLLGSCTGTTLECALERQICEADPLCVTALWHFIVAFGVLGGLGTALTFVPAVSAIGHFFLAGRATATGIAATGSSIGGVVLPLVLQSLYPRLGFAWATRILGFLFILLLVVANTLIRSRLPYKALKTTGVLPDLRIFQSIPYTLFVLGVFLSEWGLFIPINYISSFAIDQGFPTALSYQLLAILNAGSFFGRWIPGIAADRIGRFNTMILTVALCLVITAATWLPASYSNPIPLTIIYAAVFGFASGSNISLTPPCIGQLCSTDQYGKYYSTCYMIVSVG